MEKGISDIGRLDPFCYDKGKLKTWEKNLLFLGGRFLARVSVPQLQLWKRSVTRPTAIAMCPESQMPSIALRNNDSRGKFNSNQSGKVNRKNRGPRKLSHLFVAFPHQQKEGLASAITSHQWHKSIPLNVTNRGPSNDRQGQHHSTCNHNHAMPCLMSLQHQQWWNKRNLRVWAPIFPTFFANWLRLGIR